MTLLEEFASPEAVREVRFLEEQLQARHKLEPPMSFLEDQGFSSLQVDAVLDRETPPAGIFGAGVISVDGHESVAIFVTDILLGDRTDLGRLASADGVYDTAAAPILSRYMDLSRYWEMSGKDPKDLKVVGLPQPEEQASLCPGNELISGRIRGTCGIQVVTSTGAPGVLSAGHVLQQVGAAVESMRTPVGTVSFCDYLSAHSTGTDVADVGVVDLDSTVAMSGLYSVTSQGSAKALDEVVAHGQNGARVGIIIAAVPSFALRRGVGCWKDALITDRAISQAGDSGAPVYLNDGSGTVVGHIVAGHPPAYSVFQDIGYLLQEASVVLT